MYQYKYPHPAVTADAVVFGFDGKRLHVLLIERKIEPFKGSWALPGGFMHMDETIEQCAKRELEEETGVRNVYLEQFHVFSDPGRDPRERVVTVAFFALVRKADFQLIAGDDAARASWFDWDELPPLAFDHTEIIAMARRHLPEVLQNRPIAFKLLDEVFSMPELQTLYELINNTTYDRRNFARKMTSSKYLKSMNLKEVEDDEDDFNVDAKMSCSNEHYRSKPSIGNTMMDLCFSAPMEDCSDIDSPKPSRSPKRYLFDDESYEKDTSEDSIQKNPFNP